MPVVLKTGTKNTILTYVTTRLDPRQRLGNGTRSEEHRPFYSALSVLTHANANPSSYSPVDT